MRVSAEGVILNDFKERLQSANLSEVEIAENYGKKLEKGWQDVVKVKVWIFCLSFSYFLFAIQIVVKKARSGREG